MSSLSAQDLPQQQILGDERDFVTTAEPIRQPFSAVFGLVEPFRLGELLRRDSTNAIMCYEMYILHNVMPKNKLSLKANLHDDLQGRAICIIITYHAEQPTHSYVTVVPHFQ